MSSDPWGSTDDIFGDDQLVADAVAVPGVPAVGWAARRRLVGVVALVVSLVALVASFAGARGYAMVGLASLAYALAVLADLFVRRSRYRLHNYSRCLTTVALRVATFAAALWVGWLAASSMAGA